MCVRTFVVQCMIMTGRDFRKEVAFKGVKHRALDDCRHQIEYLVKARNLLMPPSKLERMLPSPETSFSSSNGDVEEVLKGVAHSLSRTPMVPPLNNGVSQDTSLSSAVGEARTGQSGSSLNAGERLGAMNGQDTARDELASIRSYMYNGRYYSSNGVRQAHVPQIAASNRRRRTQPVKVANQLLTPETSFSAEEYEKEYELGKQEDQRRFSSHG